MTNIKVSLNNIQSPVLGFEGFGTSLCWWANRIGYSDILTKKAAELFFSDDGLALSVMRYNIGGGDDPTHNHIKRTDSAVPGWLTPDSDPDNEGEFIFEPDADRNQINVLLESYKAAGDRAMVEVFSNSPPYFMTVSGCASGSPDGISDNLKDYEQFADYLASVTKYIEEELNVKVTSLDPMNEPDTDFWKQYSPKQEGCHISPGENQSKIIKLTYDALREAGVDDVIISASDETSTDKAISSYYAYSAEAKDCIGRINTHTYGVVDIDKLGAIMRENSEPFWMSEVDGADMLCKGEMGCPLWLVKKAITDMNALAPSAWVLWQVIDTHISKDGYNGNMDSGMPNLEKGFWGLAVADHDNEEIILTKKYYAFGQLSKYIRPGMSVITTGEESIAAYDNENHSLVIVSLNASDEDTDVLFDLSDFSSIGDMAERVRTSEEESLAPLSPVKTSGAALVVRAKKHSVTTYIINDIYE